MQISITRNRGALFQLNITQAGQPLDLTGKTVKFGAAEQLGDAPIISKDTNTNGITIIDAVNGVAQLELDPADTAGLADQSNTVLLFEVIVLNGAVPFSAMPNGEPGKLLVQGNIIP